MKRQLIKLALIWIAIILTWGYLFVGCQSQITDPIEPNISGRYDNENMILMLTQGVSTGRQIKFNLDNRQNSSNTFAGCTVNIYADLYTLPWKTQ